MPVSLIYRKIRVVIIHKKARPEVVLISFIALDYTILCCRKIRTVPVLNEYRIEIFFTNQIFLEKE